MHKVLLSGLAVLAAGSFAVAASAADRPADRAPAFTPAPWVQDHKLPIHNAASFFNSVDGLWYGNICKTPAGWCVQVNYSIIGIACVCATPAGPIYGITVGDPSHPI